MNRGTEEVFVPTEAHIAFPLYLADIGHFQDKLLLCGVYQK